MNSLSDILSQKADDLFATTPHSGVDESAVALPTLPDTHKTLRSMIYSMKNQLDAMLRVLDGGASPAETTAILEILPAGERVVEGAFNGEKMLGDNGKEYAVPPNYASKSKIVDGDRMKLTITKSGSFIYKQIGPVDRKRAVGELALDSITNMWSVISDGRTYKVLTASVTFYKGKSGDEVILLLPRGKESAWGAVDNIIAK